MVRSDRRILASFKARKIFTSPFSSVTLTFQDWIETLAPVSTKNWSPIDPAQNHDNLCKIPNALYEHQQIEPCQVGFSYL